MAQTTLSQPGDTGAPSPAPQLSPEALAALGDALLAISGELQSHDDDASRSLNDWLAWLDDEGYDQPLACEALQTLCQQQLAPEAYGALLADARAMAEQGEGLQPLIQQLEASQPLLLEQLLEIEQQRHTQLETLQARAGGMSKVEAGLTGAAAGVVVTGAIVFGAHWIAGKRRKAAEKELEAKQAVRHEENDLRREGQELIDSPDSATKALIEAQQSMNRANAVRTGQAFDIGKPGSLINADDVLKLAQDVGAAHQMQFPEKYGKILMNDETTKLFHDSPDFKSILKDHTVQILKNDPGLMKDAERKLWPSEEGFAEHLMESKFKENLSLLKQIDDSEGFKLTYDQAWERFQSGIKNQDLRNPMAAELKARYKPLIEKSIQDEIDVNQMLGEAEKEVHTFRIKLDEAIFDDKLIKNFSLEQRVDRFLVGKMKQGMEDDKAALKEDAVSHKEAIASELKSDVMADVSQDLQRAKQSAESDARKSMSEFKDEIEGEAVQMDKEVHDSIRTAERDSGDLMSF